MKARLKIDNASKSQDSTDEESVSINLEKRGFAGFKTEQVSASHPEQQVIQESDSDEDCDFEGFAIEEMLVFKCVAGF